MSKEIQEKCPACGGLCTMSWSGLDLVENTGDETLASKHYTSIPSFEETQFEPLSTRIKLLEDGLRESLSMMEQTLSYRENNGLTMGNIFLSSTIDTAKQLLNQTT